MNVKYIALRSANVRDRSPKPSIFVVELTSVAPCHEDGMPILASSPKWSRTTLFGSQLSRATFTVTASS